jgi:hypothetical protein
VPFLAQLWPLGGFKTAPRSGRHGNQWEEEGEDERINNIDRSGRWTKKAAEGVVCG